MTTLGFIRAKRGFNPTYGRAGHGCRAARQPATYARTERFDRHPLGRDGPEFRDQQALEKEMELIFNICNGCRRCDKKRPGIAGAFGSTS